MGETLRISGKAYIVQGDDLLEKLSGNGQTPILALGVEVTECFIHCAKAFIRSGLWIPEKWTEKNGYKKTFEWRFFYKPIQPILTLIIIFSKMKYS